MSDDFTRCLGSVRECVKYIPHTGFSYAWIDELFDSYLKALKEKADCVKFEQFYNELVELQREGKLELAGAGQDIRERSAKDRSTINLSNLMEECFKQMLREGKITKVNWMYRKL